MESVLFSFICVIIIFLRNTLQGTQSVGLGIQTLLKALVQQSQVFVVLCDTLYRLYLPPDRLLYKYLVLGNKLPIIPPEKSFVYHFYDIADVCKKLHLSFCLPSYRFSILSLNPSLSNFS